MSRVGVYELCDTHSHLDFELFDEGIDALLVACRDAGILRHIVPSVDRSSWGRISDLEQKYESVFAAYGLHPLSVGKYAPVDIDALREFISQRRERVVAVGEIGLDASVPDMGGQLSMFESQLQVAREFSLPVILHARKTHSQILQGIGQKPVIGGVIHAFSGSVELLKQYVAKGIMIGVGGVITRPSASKTRHAIAEAPLESLLLETDSPDMRVHGSTYKAADAPLDILAIFTALCGVRSESPKELSAALKANVERLFFSS